MRRLQPLPRVPERDPEALKARIHLLEREKKNTAVLRRELEIIVARQIRREVKAEHKGA